MRGWGYGWGPKIQKQSWHRICRSQILETFCKGRNRCFYSWLTTSHTHIVIRRPFRFHREMPDIHFTMPHSFVTRGFVHDRKDHERNIAVAMVRLENYHFGRNFFHLFPSTLYSDKYLEGEGIAFARERRCLLFALTVRSLPGNSS